jgi:SAM-dependent methyltransferase
MVSRGAVVPSAPHPFDQVAASYDAAFTNRWLGRWYRAILSDVLASSFEPGQRVLDLGCGTGEDAIWLAGRGVNVTATDASSVMLEQARSKAEKAERVGSITFARLDLNALTSPRDLFDQLGDLAPRDGLFDGAFSSFGPLNCVSDRRALASALSGALRPKSRVVLVVMGPLCPWELAWHAGHLELRTAVRRLRSGAAARVGDAAMPVWYPSMRRLASEFSPHFEVVDRLGMGVLLPPSGMAALADRAPRLFGRLAAVERWLTRALVSHLLNDHYVLVLERR